MKSLLICSRLFLALAEGLQPRSPVSGNCQDGILTVNEHGGRNYSPWTGDLRADFTMQGKLVLVGVKRDSFNEYAWNEFETEMLARDWSQLPENEALFAATVDRDTSDSTILRTVDQSVVEAAEECGVFGCETTCVVADPAA